MATDQLQDDRSFWWACVDIKVLRDPNLSAYAKVVYAMLCTYASTDGKRVCFPGILLLAQMSGCSERTVQRVLSELVGAGYIIKQERYKDNAQTTSLYRIVGHLARGGVRESPGGCQSDTGGVSESHPELEPLKHIKHTATQGALLPENIESKIPISFDISEKVPHVMVPTVEYLLLKTGRVGLIGEEIGPIVALEKTHMPARVQKEIGKAVERFERMGRSLSSLTFGYIYDSMKHQQSTKIYRDKNEAPRNRPPAKVAEDTEYEKLVAQRFGGEGHGPAANESRSG